MKKVLYCLYGTFLMMKTLSAFAESVFIAIRFV